MVRNPSSPSQPVFCVSLCQGPLQIPLWRSRLQLPRHFGNLAAPGLSLLVFLFFVSPFGCRSSPVGSQSLSAHLFSQSEEPMVLPSSSLFSHLGREKPGLSSRPSVHSWAPWTGVLPESSLKRREALAYSIFREKESPLTGVHCLVPSQGPAPEVSARTSAGSPLAPASPAPVF